jgi:hypothetical protein
MPVCGVFPREKTVLARLMNIIAFGRYSVIKPA